jgi:hypothetical protein
MFNTREDRGLVLLAVRVHSARWTVFLWVVSIVLVCLMGSIMLLKPHGWRTSFPSIPFILLYLSQIHDYLFYPRIEFRESGVEIPANRDCRRVRFMRWSQIHRWSWDGDLLILTGAHSQGGAVRIPGTERLAVERLMTTRLTVR